MLGARGSRGLGEVYDCAVLCCVVLCCAVLCGAVLCVCWAVLCCVVLCGAVLCCVVLVLKSINPPINNCGPPKFYEGGGVAFIGAWD